MAEWITVQGTRSGVGKSLVTAKIIEILSENHSVAPFKPLNFSRNSFPVESSEIGYSTFHQSKEAGIDPQKEFAPVLVKPMSDKTEIITKKGVDVVGYSDLDDEVGEKYGLIEECIERLDEDFDYVVWEGFGSMINSNLENNPNIDFLEETDAKIILVGDISRGGIEASIKGVHELLSKNHQDKIELNLVNKASKDSDSLEKTLDFIKKSTGTETVALPFVDDLGFPEEDGKPEFDGNGEIAVISYPHMSNTSDLGLLPEEKTCMVENPDDLEGAKLIILPGSKNTLADFQWMRDQGLTDKIRRMSENCTVFGVCGGFQMMGEKIVGNSVEEGSVDGLGLLDMETVFSQEKTLETVDYKFENVSHTGYRIHYGESSLAKENLFETEKGQEGFFETGLGGTYIHDSLRNLDFLEWLLDEAGVEAELVKNDASEIKDILEDEVGFL